VILESADAFWASFMAPPSAERVIFAYMGVSLNVPNERISGSQAVVVDVCPGAVRLTARPRVCLDYRFFITLQPVRRVLRVTILIGLIKNSPRAAKRV
jgi:hypothetical protein